MTKLRAFVGHSFDQQDEATVSKFLNFFKTLQDGELQFGWENALKAEPLELAEKVLQRMEDKNLFIGICTKKEQVLLRDNNPKNYLNMLLPSEYAWKTSDWIIQEIGLAIGRRMELILLVEEGVRPRGSLQGSLEYIVFNRAHPEASFTRILQMLQALLPRAASPVLVTSEAPPTQIDNEVPSEPLEAGIMEPQANWGREHYQKAFFGAALLNDEAKQLEITESFTKSNLASDDEKNAAWKAECERIKIACSKDGNIDNIRILLSRHPENSHVVAELGRTYALFKEYTEASNLLRRAARLASTPEQVILNLKRAAICYYHAGKIDDVWGVVEEIRQYLAHTQRDVLIALKEIFEKIGLHVFSIAIMERLTQLTPGSSDDSFALGYIHSEHGSKALSLYHYSRVPYGARSAMLCNNLGVAYESFNLPSLAVSSYKQSKEMKETLAMNNLAIRYMNSGFLDEAKRECEEAKKLPDYHNNINYTLANLALISDEEAKKEKEVLAEARPIVEFLRNYGRALCAPIAVDLEGHWVHPKYGSLVFTIQGKKIEARGSYARPANALAAAL